MKSIGGFEEGSGKKGCRCSRPRVLDLSTWRTKMGA